MELDVDTFLVTVYCTVDDLYREQVEPAKPISARYGPSAGSPTAKYGASGPVGPTQPPGW